MAGRMTSTALSTLASGAVEVSETGWRPNRELDYDEWVAVGRDLQRVGRAWQWWIGDWVLYGEKRYGDKYAEAIELTGMEYQTLRNVVSVSRAVELSRRRDNLSWSHHAEVASLDPARQEEWLDRADTEHLTVERLRSALRSSGVRKTQEQPAGDPFRSTITFEHTAVDFEDATEQVKLLARKLEQAGVKVNHKQTKPC
jgi:hypothetical protein